MKTIKYICTALLVLGFLSQADAQIWKKIKKAVKRGVEKTIEGRAEEEAKEKTDKALDNIFDFPITGDGSEKDGEGGLFNLKGAAAPKDVYTFNYEYIAQHSDGKNSFEMTYYLSSEAPYFATTAPADGNTTQFTIFDTDEKTSHVFIEEDGKKTRVSIRVDINLLAQKAKEKADFTITPLNEQKNIVGYPCKGYKIVGSTIEGKHMETTAWVYENPPVNFAMGMGMMKNTSMGGAGGVFHQFESGLVMEMEVYMYEKNNRGKRKKEEYSKLVCTSFKEVPVTIETEAYQSMF